MVTKFYLSKERKRLGFPNCQEEIKLFETFSSSIYLTMSECVPLFLSYQGTAGSQPASILEVDERAWHFKPSYFILFPSSVKNISCRVCVRPAFNHIVRLRKKGQVYEKRVVWLPPEGAWSAFPRQQALWVLTEQAQMSLHAASSRCDLAKQVFHLHFYYCGACIFQLLWLFPHMLGYLHRNVRPLPHTVFRVLVIVDTDELLHLSKQL